MTAKHPPVVVTFTQGEITVEDAINLTGPIPMWLDVNNPDKAAKQLDANYQHGGGWRPITQFTLDKDTGYLSYPGDPVLKPLATIHFRDELILVYPFAIFCIIQPDDTYEAARMD